jgi:hypothetical protein
MLDKRLLKSCCSCSRLLLLLLLCRCQLLLLLLLLLWSLHDGQSVDQTLLRQKKFVVDESLPRLFTTEKSFVCFQKCISVR